MMTLGSLSKAEAARYMGVKGEPDGNVQALLDKYEPIVRGKLRPAYVYREAAVSFEDGGVRISGVNALLTGGVIRRHLAGCERAVLLAATVSAEADKLIRQTAVTDMAAALAVDCLCSAAVEQVCDRAEEEIFSEVDAPFRTWRFSPGYGDLPIALQRDLLLALNAQRRIGLTVTESSLLVPSKSVTAIIGISAAPPESELKRGCESCNMRGRCAFSANGGCGRKN